MTHSWLFHRCHRFNKWNGLSALPPWLLLSQWPHSLRYFEIINDNRTRNGTCPLFLWTLLSQTVGVCLQCHSSHFKWRHHVNYMTLREDHGKAGHLCLQCIGVFFLVMGPAKQQLTVGYINFLLCTYKWKTRGLIQCLIKKEEQEKNIIYQEAR